MKAHCLPFSQIPHTTRLFTDFLSYLPKFSRSIRGLHISPVDQRGIRQGFLTKIPAQNGGAVLERQNESWNASPKTLANLERLRNGATAVVTGQQVGLFGGPMFALYKALTAVKLAEQATAAGVERFPFSGSRPTIMISRK